MEPNPDAPVDLLWKEYSAIFKEFDDLSLGRWLSQTLSQLEGRTWRLSHPLLSAYRLGAQVGHERQIWLKRLVAVPARYPEATCCRAPLLPLLTRDVKDAGLICQHCNDTAITFDDIPESARAELEKWASEYGPIHAVAHWDDRQRKGAGDYDRAFEKAARQAERLLTQAQKLAVTLLEFYPAVVWEDQDERLEVRAEDVPIK